jgi:hypothetical protein
VDISAALAADLAALTDGLGDPQVDLETQLRTLAADLARAVASFSGLTMTIRLDDRAVSFSAGAGAGDGIGAAEASVEIPLSPLTGAQDGSSLLVFAAVAGAFVDLAADLSYILDLNPVLLVLDQHLHLAATPDGAGMAGLDEYSLVNQAIGVVIARGHTPDSALEELRRLAALDGGALGSGAAAVLRTLAARRSIDDRSAEGRESDPRQ